MIDNVFTTPSIYVQSNLYERLNENFDNYGTESVLYRFLFLNYEKKIPRADGKIEDNIRSIINHIREIVEKENFSFPDDLNGLHKKLTTFQTKKDKIKHPYKNGYENNPEFPSILRYLNYKVEHLKSTKKKENASSIKEVIRKVSTENIQLSQKEILTLLKYYETCDTYSRCYDFLFRMKNKTEKPNCYLQLIQFLFEENFLSDEDLFKGNNKNNTKIKEIRNKLLKSGKPKNDSFFIPLLTDSSTNTMLALMQAPQSKNNDETLEIRIKNACPKTKKILTVFKEVETSYYLYYWAYDTIKGLEYKSKKIRTEDITKTKELIDAFTTKCTLSLDAIKGYNSALDQLNDTKYFEIYAPPRDSKKFSEAQKNKRQTARCNSEATGKQITPPTKALR